MRVRGCARACVRVALGGDFAACLMKGYASAACAAVVANGRATARLARPLPDVPRPLRLVRTAVTSASPAHSCNPRPRRLMHPAATPQPSPACSVVPSSQPSLHRAPGCGDGPGHATSAWGMLHGRRVASVALLIAGEPRPNGCMRRTNSCMLQGHEVAYAALLIGESTAPAGACKGRLTPLSICRWVHLHRR
eukprot:64665-Chlamydomonas_euryale.AAC.5